MATDKNGIQIRNGDKVIVVGHGDGKVIRVNDDNTVMAITVVLDEMNADGEEHSVCVPGADVEVK